MAGCEELVPSYALVDYPPIILALAHHCLLQPNIPQGQYNPTPFCSSLPFKAKHLEGDIQDVFDRDPTPRTWHKRAVYCSYQKYTELSCGPCPFNVTRCNKYQVRDNTILTRTFDLTHPSDSLFRPTTPPFSFLRFPPSFENGGRCRWCS